MKEKKIDTRLEDHLFALVDTYSKRHGLKRTQVVVMALEKFFGLQHADPVEFARGKILPMPRNHALETRLLTEEISPPIAASQTTTPTKYPKPKK